jgi:hypothetical protein
MYINTNIYTYKLGFSKPKEGSMGTYRHGYRHIKISICVYINMYINTNIHTYFTYMNVYNHFENMYASKPQMKM